MKIAEAARRSDLSADTIRFYEREGLIGPITRGPDGHRVFTAQDLKWLNLFERLRATGMPMADMKRYADLTRLGARTYFQRRKILEHHLSQIDLQLQKIDDCRTLINDKIKTYLQLETEKN